MNNFPSKTESLIFSKLNKHILLSLLISTALIGCARGPSDEYSSPPNDYLDYAADPCAADPCAADPCAAVEEDVYVSPYAPGELAFTPEELQFIYALSQMPRAERLQYITPEIEESLARQFSEFRESSGQTYQSQPSLPSSSGNPDDYSNIDTEIWLDGMRSYLEGDLKEGRQSHADSVAEGATYE